MIKNLRGLYIINRVKARIRAELSFVAKPGFGLVDGYGTIRVEAAGANPFGELLRTDLQFIPDWLGRKDRDPLLTDGQMRKTAATCRDGLLRGNRCDAQLPDW